MWYKNWSYNKLVTNIWWENWHLQDLYRYCARTRGRIQCLPSLPTLPYWWLSCICYRAAATACFCSKIAVSSYCCTDLVPWYIFVRKPVDCLLFPFLFLLLAAILNLCMKQSWILYTNNLLLDLRAAWGEQLDYSPYSESWIPNKFQLQTHCAPISWRNGLDGFDLPIQTYINL